MAIKKLSNIVDPDDNEVAIIDNYTELARRINKVTAADDVELVFLKTSNSIDVHVTAQKTINNKKVDLVYTHRSFDLSKGELNNRVLLLNSSVTNKGLSALIDSAGVSALDSTGGKFINSTVGNKDGAYFLLRKGYTPEDQNFIRSTIAESSLPDHLKNTVPKRNIDRFVLSHRFKQYKPAFQNKIMSGSVDITSKINRDALLGEYVTASGFRLSNLNANNEIFEASIRHETHLLRMASGLSNDAVAVLNSSEDDINRILLSYENKGLQNRTQWARLKTLQKEIATVRRKAWKDVDNLLLENGHSLAESEAVVISDIHKTVSPTTITTVIPPPALLTSIVEDRPFEGRLLSEWAESMSASDIRRISTQIQNGMVAGESMQSISRRVLGTKVLKGVNGATQLARNDVHAVVRTAVQHIANQAQNEYAKLNKDIIDKQEYTATLDGRTTPICRSLDGNIYEVGVGPIPPVHFSCRSTRLSYFGKRVGLRPSKAITKKMLIRKYGRINDLKGVTNRDNLPIGHKVKFDKFSREEIRRTIGPVDANVNYQEFLENQSREFVQDTLGKTKSKLFIDGNLKLDKFVTANGSELTIKELAVKQRQAFIDAGLDPDNFN